MKRKLGALLLCGALCIGSFSPALAAEEALTAEREYDVTWAELDERVRSGSLNSQALGETITSIEALDYDKLSDRLRDSIGDIADAQWYMTLSGNSVGASMLQESYDALKESFDAISDGDMQKDNADAVRQIENGIDQIVVVGETLYITILGLEQTLADGNRGLATLDRSLTELRLRRDLGQVSNQQVAALEQTRAETVSQLSTLENAISTCKLQLQALMGEEPTGQLTLAPLPEEDGANWSAPDYDADLAAAKEHSWTLYSAKLTLDDAEEAWKDDRFSKYQYVRVMAEHTWSAAQTTYAAEVQSFETSFRTLYNSLSDYQQVWESKQSAVAYQEMLLTTAQTRYDRGMISYNALMSAQDDLAAARSAEESAWRDLFSARNDYRNAVERGLL